MVHNHHQWIHNYNYVGGSDDLHPLGLGEEAHETQPDGLINL